MRRPVVLAAALAAALLTVLVAAPSLHYGFVYDDQAVVVDRKPFWELGFAEFLRSRPHGTGRHLTAISLDLDRLEAGNMPVPSHRTSVLLAALLSCLVFAFFLRVGLSLTAAGAAAALFAVHPVHVDAVVWITARSELLAAIGIVLALLACVRPASSERVGFARVAVLTGLSAAFAIHSKESAFCLPLLVVLARVFLGSRVAWIPALVGIAVAFGSWALVASTQLSGLRAPQFVDNPLVYAPVWERILKALAILWKYAALTVVPYPLLQDRSYATTNPGVVTGVLALVAWLVVAAGVWRMRVRAPIAAFAIAWFPAAFLVTGNVLRPIGTLMAERLMLLPSVGVCLLAGFAIDRFASSASARRAALAAVTAVVIVFFALFRTRAAPWESGDVYFAMSAVNSPQSAKAQYDYGSWLLRHGNAAEGETALARALAIDPSLSRAANLRAESMARRGDPAGGAKVYEDYLAVRPDDTGALANITRLLLNAGKPREAVRWAQRLVEISPSDQSALDLLNIAETAANK